mmetsp:Transcript_9190/g.26907  ORF Transcript_9190/g.26907 Transcript_9190/m.26907 type:complete len:226 (-) Transcript_9190:14-691(-)
MSTSVSSFTSSDIQNSQSMRALSKGKLLNLSSPPPALEMSTCVGFVWRHHMRRPGASDRNVTGGSSSAQAKFVGKHAAGRQMSFGIALGSDVSMPAASRRGSSHSNTTQNVACRNSPLCVSTLNSWTFSSTLTRVTPPSAGTGRSDQFTVAGSSVFGTACSAPSLALGTTLVIVLTRAHALRAAGLLSSYHSTSSPLPLACKHRAGDELCAYDAFPKSFVPSRAD